MRLHMEEHKYSKHLNKKRMVYAMRFLLYLLYEILFGFRTVIVITMSTSEEKQIYFSTEYQETAKPDI